MGFVPELAATLVVAVPDEDSARAVAAFLVERGYTTVRVAPVRGDSWQAAGLDEGPYPDGDDAWWRTVEERVVEAAVREVGGGVMWSLAHPGTARRILPAGEAVADRTVEEVRDARLAAFAGEPARSPAPEIVHRLGEPERTGELGEPVVLEGLDEVGWAALTGAYGPADAVPDILRRLAANDEGWDEAAFEYFSAVVHQDTCYDCTPATVGFLIQMARSPQLLSAYRLELLLDLFYIATLDPARRAVRTAGTRARRRAPGGRCSNTCRRYWPGGRTRRRANGPG